MKSARFLSISHVVVALSASLVLAGCFGGGATPSNSGGSGSGKPRIVGVSSPGRPPTRTAPSSASQRATPSYSAKSNAGASYAGARNSGGEMRALWVTRWDYRTPQDVSRIMDNAKAMGFNTVFFQVRGAGTAFFLSAVEPWAYELTSKSPATTGKNPGWDPLQTAIDRARRNGLQIHAYLNVLPGWESAQSPPRQTRQLWTAHRDWFMVDKSGKTMTSAKFYSFLNPALPEVRRHLATLVSDMLSRYKVDGVHLDYIRWPGDQGDFSHDKATRQRFRAQTQKLGGTEEAKWDQWRADQIRLTLREIYRAVKARDPKCLVSAAVWSDPEAARTRHCQWSWTWRPGLECDIIFPMNYSSNESILRQRSEFFAARLPSNRLGMGLRATHDISRLRSQRDMLRRLGVHHLAIFAYADFHQGHQLNAKGRLMSRFWN